MERLSERWMYYCGLLAMHGVEVDDMKHIQDLIDAEEQGLLLRLRLKVGDVIRFDDHSGVYEITGYSFGTAEEYIDDPLKTDEVIYYYKNYSGSTTGSFVESLIGDKVFLEEAEQALKDNTKMSKDDAIMAFKREVEQALKGGGTND